MTEAEIVCPPDAGPVTLAPCPAWCTGPGTHFAPGQPWHSSDGYHHYGPETQIAASSPWLGIRDGESAAVRAALKAWTQPLGAAPGPAVVELGVGPLSCRLDTFAELTPDQARELAVLLLHLADVARPGGPA